MAVVLKSSQEIEKMRRAGQIVREVLELVRSKVRPGATTYDLEKAAAARLNELGVKAAFKGYHGYPCVLCTSVNSEVVHGIPSPKRVLKEGDIVSVDFGVVVDGYYGDAAITVPVGSIDANAARLLKATEESLKAGIAAVKPGATLGDVGAGAELWRSGPGHEAESGHGHRHRAHGECRQAGCAGAGRRLDRSGQRWKHERSF
ncbi:MAG: type I methionyl aminopeptidase [Terracidiphilus sp.]